MKNVHARHIASLPLQGSQKSKTAVRLYWLGQAGFLIDFFDIRIVIDPYLSNSLNAKYRGTRFPHERMMPAPVKPNELANVDWVISTHGHTDHMDPETLQAIFDASPDARYLVPTAELDRALERGGPVSRTVGIDVDAEIALSEEVGATALPAAHEEEERDQEGHHRFLGFVFRGQGVSVYHSGDTIPFAGLRGHLEKERPDLGLLPVNGRDAKRRSNGVPGNMTLQEAVGLLTDGFFEAAIGHHYGLFDFNTVDLAEAESYLANLEADVKERFFMAKLETEYEVVPD